MYEWKVQCSKTKVWHNKTEKDGTRFSCESWTATVYAEDEREARAIITEEEPGAAIDKIIRGKYIDDG